MYEQSLDMDTFQSYLNQHTDPNEAKFYDDFFHIATSTHDWKATKRLPGLPTPPMTPDKNRFQFEAQNLQHYHVPSNQTSGLQVVPDTIEQNRWFQEEERQNEGFIPSYDMRDARCEKTQLNLQNFEAPDCILSPVSPQQTPQQNLKRAYPFHNYQSPGNMVHSSGNIIHSPNHMLSSNQMINSHGNMNHSPSSHHFSNDFLLNNPSIRSSEENYYRQLAYEKLRAQHKVVVDEIGSPQETELSRATHNVLERQRRNDLKLRFNILRDNIPELANNDKAPKIQILKKALEHLSDLKSHEQKILVDVELEKQRKIILLNRLKTLKQCF